MFVTCPSSSLIPIQLPNVGLKIFSKKCCDFPSLSVRPSVCLSLFVYRLSLVVSATPPSPSPPCTLHVCVLVCKSKTNWIFKLKLSMPLHGASTSTSAFSSTCCACSSLAFESVATTSPTPPHPGLPVFVHLAKRQKPLTKPKRNVVDRRQSRLLLAAAPLSVAVCLTVRLSVSLSVCLSISLSLHLSLLPSVFSRIYVFGKRFKLHSKQSATIPHAATMRVH